MACRRSIRRLLRPERDAVGGRGGSLGFAALAVVAGLRVARRSAFIAGTIVLGWVIVQVAIIGYVSWMQPATFIGGLAVLVLAWQLPSIDAGERVR